MSFDERLGTAMRGLVPEREPELGPVRDLAAGAEREARTRRRRRAVVGAALLTAVACVVGVLTAVSVGRPSAVEVSTPPPPVDVTRPHLLLSSTELPPTGGQLALVVVNPDPRSVPVSVHGLLERWDGAGWHEDKIFAAAPGSSTQAGVVVDHDAPLSQSGPAYKAAADGYSPWFRLATGRLDPGYYRLTLNVPGGVRPSAILRVAEGADPGPDLAPSTPVRLDVGEGRVLAGADAWTGLELDGATGGSGVGDVDAGRGAQLRRLDGARAVPVGEVKLWSPGEAPVATGSTGFTVHLPKLDPGLYDVLVGDAHGHTLRGLFWVLPVVG